METYTIDFKMAETKESIRIKQLIIHELAEIIEAYPHYNVAEHLCYLTDRKNAYRLTNKEFLKEIEKYRNKLEEEIIEGEEEYFETELYGN